jgi:hypothetical protein
MIQQGKLIDVMTQLANLPERKKAPDAPVSLSEIFRTREYMAEIKGALKKGYSFDDLARIFTEKCGVNISARQLKYRCTREKNRRDKNSDGGKSRPHADLNGNVLPENPARMNSDDGAKGEIGAAKTTMNVTAIHSPKPTAFVTSDAEAVSAETGTFPFEKRL